MSALQKALVRRAALLNALSEAEEAKFVTGDPTANIDFYGVACDRIGRIADRLGLRRVPRVINKSLADILTGEPAILTEPAQQ